MKISALIQLKQLLILNSLLNDIRDKQTQRLGKLIQYVLHLYFVSELKFSTRILQQQKSKQIPTLQLLYHSIVQLFDDNKPLEKLLLQKEIQYNSITHGN